MSPAAKRLLKRVEARRERDTAAGIQHRAPSPVTAGAVASLMHLTKKAG